MIPDLTRTELAARLRSSIEGKEAWDYVATNVGLVASAVKFLAPSAGIADAMIADAKRQFGAGPQDERATFRHVPFYRANTAQPIMWAALDLQGTAVYSHASRENVEMNARYIRTPTRIVALVAQRSASLAGAPVSVAQVGCEDSEGLLNIHAETETCNVCASVSTANPSDGPSNDKILDALVEALDVDRAGAMKLILRVAGAHLDEREAV